MNPKYYSNMTTVVQCWGFCCLQGRCGSLSTCSDHSLCSTFSYFLMLLPYVFCLPFHFVLLPAYSCLGNQHHIVFLRATLMFIKIEQQSKKMQMISLSYINEYFNQHNILFIFWFFTFNSSYLHWRQTLIFSNQTMKISQIPDNKLLKIIIKEMF